MTKQFKLPIKMRVSLFSALLCFFSSLVLR
jgi:hypothetical protein